MEIILASGSPRRSEILSSLGFDFSVILPDADESSDITDIIDSKDRRAAGITAPPQGLYLNHVYY